MILHIPHASTYIPPEISFNKADISDDIFRMTDWYTDKLFHHTNADKVTFGASRLVCDVERFIDDEPMEKYGMGVCYKNDSYGNNMRDISPDEHNYIIENYYKPHHAKLAQAVSYSLSMFDSTIIVDCHSFNDHPMPHDPYDGIRPDICIGVDEFHTPLHLVKGLIEYLGENNISYQINTPFAGSIVPASYYQQNKDVWSVMIEVNKRLYMDGDERSSNWNNTKQLVSGLLNTVNVIGENNEAT
jgi:N-formylglutamate deformylase